MTQSQALTKALHLALIAPDDARGKGLAESIAAGLTSAQVEAAKARALKLVTGAA